MNVAMIERSAHSARPAVIQPGRERRRARAIGVAALLGAALTTTATGQERLPEGKGKVTVESLCATRCHNSSPLLRLKKTPTAWEATMDIMVERGAEMSDSEYNEILDYLSTHLLATVNVNTESAARLVEVLEITEAEAAAIVERRTKHGGFSTWQEVAHVPGVDAQVIQERQARLAFK
jgi:Helix-hairpin-helix motif